MSTKYIIGCLVAAFMLGGAFGRFSAPSKVETKIVTVTDTTAHKTDNTVVVVTRTEKPDGTITTVTETKKDVVTDKESHKDTASNTTTTYDTPKLTITALMIGSPLSGMHSDIGYGLGLSYRVLGPISVSALGTSNGIVGVGIGISF